MTEPERKRRGRPPKVVSMPAEQAAPAPAPAPARGRTKKAQVNALSWEEAIERVMRSTGGAMHYTNIAKEISARGFKSVANPAASVASAFTRARSDPNSIFIPIGNGLYALKESLEPVAEQQADDIVESENETGALKALGMFWQRSSVIWNGKPKLLGRQDEGAANVDFSDQVGVYLLHDRDRVIYIGRAADTLFARLKAHTTDRLGGRWDRFSWFGLRAVSEDGQLVDAPVSWTHSVVIETMEALLIESLEPPLNRKRGDNFSGAEYLQVPDPSIEQRNMKQAFDAFLKSQSE